MAAVVYVHEIEETEIQVVPSTSMVRHCSMNKASTSSSDASSASSSRKLGKKRARACSKSLMALADRNKLRRLGRKVKKTALRAVSSLKARRVRAKIDKQYDPQIEDCIRELERNRAERRAVLEEGAQFMLRVENMTRTMREMRQQAERRQTVELAILLANLLPPSEPARF